MWGAYVPVPFSPVHSARKFSAVFGCTTQRATGQSKVNLWVCQTSIYEDFVRFSPSVSTKWNQDRTNGSKNASGLTPWGGGRDSSN